MANCIVGGAPVSRAASALPHGRVRTAPTLTLVNDVIEQIRTAFAADARPDNGALLHSQCGDDMDLQALYEVGHWSEVPDDLVISEYAALAFLSAEGFRHFIPAYLIWVLRHPDAGEAVVDSTIWAFLPELHGAALAGFVRSKWAALDAEQRAAITSFLRTMVDHHADAEGALAAWVRDGQPDDGGTRHQH